MAYENDQLKNNLISFREAFKDYSDCYTVIGGTACFILMNEAGIRFRATRDIDMILVMEERGSDFGRVFWDYIIQGGYICGWKNSDVHYYRFTDPKPGYPKQIELFSRREDFQADSRIIPVHISDDVSSLSAIALDEDFYRFMLEGRTVTDQISVLKAEYIIPFKMYAWINNRRLRQEGKAINTDDIKKHKNDVFRLMTLVNPDERVATEGHVKSSVTKFLSDIQNEPVDKKLLGSRTKEEALDILRTIYLENK